MDLPRQKNGGRTSNDVELVEVYKRYKSNVDGEALLGIDLAF